MEQKGTRGMSISMWGDIMEVRLRDNNYNTYFKDKADINNPKQMEALKERLRSKGVSL